ncbi:hypothetical protein V1527DRAFT_521761 [Lipomyces starkeyi]
MNGPQVTMVDSKYCQKCAACRTLVCCDTLKELQQMYSGRDGHAFKTCKKCRDRKASKRQDEGLKRASFDLDGCYDTHEEFIDAVSSVMDRHDNHVFDASAQPLRVKATLTSSLLIDNEISVEACTQTADNELQKRAATLLRNSMFDITGYFFHMRRVNARADGQTSFTLTCSRSNECKLERDISRVQRYTVSKEVFDCQGELRITMSKVYESVTMVYEHKGHMETNKFHMTEEVRNYIKSQKRLAPRQIYQNLIQMANEGEFEKTDLHTITRQQVYNFWLSITKSEWERDAANDFRSAQLLVAEQGGFQLIEGLQEPGVSLAFVTPCFTNQEQYSRAKMTEVFVDSTFGTNKHGYELYCVLTEYDLVSLPLSYLLLDTRCLHEEGKRGRRLTQWFTALRNAGLDPNTVHTDKDFAEVTAASIAFKTNNSRFNHHLCLGLDSADTVKASTRMTALPSYLHFLSEEGQTKRCTTDQARRHLLRHPLLPRVVVDKDRAPEALVYESYEEIHASSIKEMLDYCKSIDQPRLFRYFWTNWYRPSFGNVGSRPGSSCAIPISRTTMRLESHWRILKRDYASHLIKPRLDSRIHLYLQVEAGRVKPSLYEDFVSLWRHVIDHRNNLYHTDKMQWVCSCPYMCKHLVSYYSFPRHDRVDLFQERLPLIRFDDFDFSSTECVSPTEGSINCVDSEQVAQSSTYMKELESLQLLPSEDPEATEQDDERSLELLRIMQWAAGESHSNQRMQRDLCGFIRNQDEFIARFKRPYEEAMGKTRSADSQTMRKAQKSYYYMRPQNHGHPSI